MVQDVLLDALCVYKYTAIAVFSVCPEKQHGVGCVAPKVCSPTQKAVFCYTAKDVIVKITCVDKKLRACYDKAHRNWDSQLTVPFTALQ